MLALGAGEKGQEVTFARAVWTTTGPSQHSSTTTPIRLICQLSADAQHAQSCACYVAAFRWQVTLVGVMMYESLGGPVILQAARAIDTLQLEFTRTCRIPAAVSPCHSQQIWKKKMSRRCNMPAAHLVAVSKNREKKHEKEIQHF